MKEKMSTSSRANFNIFPKGKIPSLRNVLRYILVSLLPREMKNLNGVCIIILTLTFNENIDQFLKPFFELVFLLIKKTKIKQHCGKLRYLINEILRFLKCVTDVNLRSVG